MIEEARMVGSIDQIEQVVEFQKSMYTLRLFCAKRFQTSDIGEILLSQKTHT